MISVHCGDQRVANCVCVYTPTHSPGVYLPCCTVQIYNIASFSEESWFAQTTYPVVTPMCIEMRSEQTL